MVIEKEKADQHVRVGKSAYDLIIPDYYSV